MRQKILCLIVLFSLVLTLTGCGSNKTVSPENQAAVSDVKAEDNPVAAILMPRQQTKQIMPQLTSMKKTFNRMISRAILVLLSAKTF
jgi:uncharacterized lipoprotein